MCVQLFKNAEINIFCQLMLIIEHDTMTNLFNDLNKSNGECKLSKPITLKTILSNNPRSRNIQRGRCFQGGVIFYQNFDENRQFRT